MDQPKPANKALVGIIVAIVLIGATAGTIYFTKNDSSVSTASTTIASVGTSDTGTTNMSGSSTMMDNSMMSYKNGTYQATSSYRTPESTESIDVSVTLMNSIITDITIKQTARKQNSEFYQAQFADNYKSEVVGKNVNEVNLSRVAGSSLTSGGFNDALDTIKQDAKA